jgi:monoamine oxidase
MKNHFGGKWDFRAKVRAHACMLFNINHFFAVFTDDGPICNYYDASSHDGKVAALIGFIAGKHAIEWHHRTQEVSRKLQHSACSTLSRTFLQMSENVLQERRQAVMTQLVSLLGSKAAEPCGYVEKNWMDDPFSRGGL